MPLYFDNTCYFVDDGDWRHQVFNAIVSPLDILYGELWKSREIKWMKVTSADIPPEECKRFPRWVRIMLAVFFFFPAAVCIGINESFEFFNEFRPKANHILENWLITEKHKQHIPLVKLDSNRPIQFDSHTFTIRNLPEEILQFIFQTAIGSNPKAFVQLSKVDRLFNKIANDPAIWSSILSDIGIKITQENFAERIPEIICRYTLMKTEAPQIRALFKNKDEFSQLPIIFLQKEWLPSEKGPSPDLIVERCSIEYLNELDFEKAQKHKRALLVSPKGCMGLFLKSHIENAKNLNIPSESWLIIITTTDKIDLLVEFYFNTNDYNPYQGHSLNFDKMTAPGKTINIKKLLTNETCEVSFETSYQDRGYQLSLLK